VTLSNLLIFTIAVFGTTMNYSPFINFLGEQRLGVLQVFLGVLATSGMFLAAAVREKDEAVEARNEFLAIASHELKTPLTTLGLQVYLSAKKFKESGSEMVFGKIEGQVQRLGRIVEQLLDVSRFDRKTIRMNYDHLELKNFIERTVENHAEDLRKAGCTVKLNLENPINCCWDSFRIEQVFENILSNCIKYAPQSPIEVTARKDEEFATIQIRDRGPGIDKTRQHYVFDRFVRASGATHVDGLGLGLYITRQIVLGHNGKIWIDCPQGKGCTVSIRIPLRPINAVIAAVESSTSFEINSRIRSD
jgi:signal transduction histidine kinase